jgi:hypothetical protein
MTHWLDSRTIGKPAKTATPTKKGGSVPLPPGVAFQWDKSSLDKPKKGVTKLPIPDAMINSRDEEIYNICKFLLALLMAQGIAHPAVGYAVTQCTWETDWFTNNGWKLYNNASGIMYAGQKNAKLGPNGYAIFNTWQDWAVSMAHELNKGSQPALATNLTEYATRLKANRYFTAPLAQYLAGLKKNNERLLRLQKKGQLLKSADKHIKEYKESQKAKEKGLKWWQWGLIGVAGVLVVKKVSQ